jgi:predicted DNA-binding protein (MmcQ/YjbR family)
MNIENIRGYCLKKKYVTESFPFDETTLVFKVHNKMFALIDIEDKQFINLKCDPDRAIQLREEFSEITPGYHMNKKLWNSVSITGSLKDQFIMELIDDSYDLIFAGLPKKVREGNV